MFIIANVKLPIKHYVEIISIQEKDPRIRDLI